MRKIVLLIYILFLLLFIFSSCSAPDGYVYAFSGDDLSDFLSDASNEGKTLQLKTDISSDESFSIGFPFTLKTDGYRLNVKELIFTSEIAGTMSIHNGEDEINCDITCVTPEWDYEIDVLFSSFLEEEYCRVNAKSVNDKPIDKTSVYIGNIDDWNLHFASGNEKFSVITFGSLVVPEYTFDYPLTINSNGNTTFDGGLSVVTDEKGSVIINAPREAIKYLYCPDCDVLFTQDAYDYDYAENHFAFASYNGVSRPEWLYFGGTTPENITLDGINGVIDGNCLILYTSFLDKLTVSSELLEVTGENIAESTIADKNGDYYLVVTDNEGKKRSYKILIVKQNNNLPVIYIDIEDGKSVVSQDEYLGCLVTVDYNGFEECESFAVIDSLPAGIKGRGYSSWMLPKKPYKLKFETKTSLFGLTKAKKWVLQANHIDRTLFRNTLAMRLGAVLDNMVFIPHSYPVDLFVNGEYVGVYTLTEQIEVNKGRIEGEEDSTEIDTDYLMEMGEEGVKTSFGTNVFHSAIEKFMEIKNPDSDVLTKEQLEFVRDYFNKADETVKKGKGYEEYIDIDSLIDWFILDELSYNVDCTFRRSVYYLKQKNGKIFFASPWDFDYAFGNFRLDDDSYQGWICLGNSKTNGDNPLIKTNWMTYLLKNNGFKQKLKARWDEVGEKLYKTAIETIDSLSTVIAPSAEINFTVWNGMFGNIVQYESEKTGSLMTHEEQIDYLRWFIETRYNWINSEIAKY